MKNKMHLMVGDKFISDMLTFKPETNQPLNKRVFKIKLHMHKAAFVSKNQYFLCLQLMPYHIFNH